MTPPRFHAWQFVAATLAVALVPPASAQMFDVLQTRGSVAVAPAAPLLHDASCTPVAADHALELQEAILQAICAHPRAARAWANARAQAAAVGLVKSAYLPRLNATAGGERDTLSTTYDYRAIGLGSHTQAQDSSSRYGMLNLSWVLFDFGKRSAALRQARELLAAANAAQDDALQTVFFDAAQAYYTVRDAQAALDAARETEAVANESCVTARAKHEGGAGTLSDQLQAQTTYRRAVLDRVSAEGDLRTATGALAAALGLDANTPLRIASGNQDEKGDGNQALAGEAPAVSANVDALLDEAKRRQPKLVAARAQLEAARANVDAARALGRPTISLVGSMTHNNPSYRQQPESFPITHSHGTTIGIQLTIPLFEGFASGYRVAQARAAADAQEADLRDTELRVSLEVWRSYQALRTDAANLTNSKELLGDAQRALEIARGRYKAGVGTFVELLNAQTALADAQRQRVGAVSQWRTASLRLAASLGDLGLWRTE